LASRIRIGVVTAWPSGDWHSGRLLEACARRAAAEALDPAELAAFVGEGALEVRAAVRSARRFDAFVLARGLGQSGDPDVQFEIYRALEGTGALVVNRIDALLTAQDKFRTSWLLQRAGVPTPRAAVAQSRRAAMKALDALGQAVLKPVCGSLGEGLERVRADRSGRRSVLACLERDGAVYLQKWVPNPGQDARVFVVGGRAAGAMRRLAPPGEWIANIARGGRALAGADAATCALAERAAAALGLDYAGVDIVTGPEGPTVIEVNGNPSWHGLFQATGADMAEPIAEHVLARAVRRRERRLEPAPKRMGATHG
jgi:tetrahydromethanopterin:alpha-L-glutamate ligase